MLPVVTKPQKPPPGSPPAATAKEQFNVRLPPELRDGLDAWLAKLNEGRRVPLKRSDMVRGILEWAVEHRPDWEHVGPQASPPVPDAARGERIVELEEEERPRRR